MYGIQRLSEMIKGQKDKSLSKEQNQILDFWEKNILVNIA